MNYYFVTPAWLKLWYGSLTWTVKTPHKEIYLTFDDGPVPEVTPFVLQQLSRVQAKATFFCVGENIKKNPSLFKELISEGHSPGNHTYHHVNGWREATGSYLYEVQKCQEQLLMYTDECKLFRPPYGRIRKEQVRELQEDYRIVMWSHLSGDFDKALNVGRSVDRLKTATKGSILVFHDSLKAYDNMKKILPELLSYFRDRGFTFKSL